MVKINPVNMGGKKDEEGKEANKRANKYEIGGHDGDKSKDNAISKQTSMKEQDEELSDDDDEPRDKRKKHSFYQKTKS